MSEPVHAKIDRRNTSAILLDMSRDARMAGNLRRAIEGEGDKIADLHMWRLGPGHLR